MRGKVEIVGRGIRTSRRYSSVTERNKIIKEVADKFELTSYTLTITPDDEQEQGNDIKHSRSVIFLRNTCATCILLQTNTVVGYRV